MYHVRAAALFAMLGSFLLSACSMHSGDATSPLPAQQDVQPQSIATAPQTQALSTSVVSGVPMHVMTGAFVYGYAGTPVTVPLSSIVPYVTWAFTDTVHAPILRSHGIKVTSYVLFWRNHVSDNPLIGYLDLKPGGAHAAAEATDCSGHPIYDPIYNGGYAADARKPAALPHARVSVDYRLQQYGKNLDALFTDEVGTFYGMQPPCGYNAATYNQAVNNVHAALGVPMIVNALGSHSTAALAFSTPSNILGEMCEICLSRNNGTLDTSDYGYWQFDENAEMTLAQRHKIFWVYARTPLDAASQIPQRKYVVASFLLSYDVHYSMLEEAYSTPSGLAIMPETGLVPMNPLTTASTVAGYRRSGGAYMREFANCYYRGVNRGGCAVVVNPNLTSAPVPTSVYAHSLLITGRGVLDGGTVSFSGPRVTALGKASAAILFH